MNPFWHGSTKKNVKSTLLLIKVVVFIHICTNRTYRHALQRCQSKEAAHIHTFGELLISQKYDLFIQNVIHITFFGHVACRSCSAVVLLVARGWQHLPSLLTLVLYVTQREQEKDLCSEADDYIQSDPEKWGQQDDFEVFQK